MMSIIFKILFWATIVFLWRLIGSIICRHLDNKYYKGRLLEWAFQGPFSPEKNVMIVELIWPYVVYNFYKDWRKI